MHVPRTHAGSPRLASFVLIYRACFLRWWGQRLVFESPGKGGRRDYTPPDHPTHHPTGSWRRVIVGRPTMLPLSPHGW